MGKGKGQMGEDLSRSAHSGFNTLPMNKDGRIGQRLRSTCRTTGS
jgi:hypothetical protein